MLGFSVEPLIENMGVFYYVLVYGIGVLAISLSVFAFQLKYRTAIIICSFSGQTAWVAHFLLQGDLTSAIVCSFSAVVLMLFSKKEKWPWTTHPLMLVLFILIFVGLSALSFKVWSDIFPPLAGVFLVIANSRETEKRLRQFSFFYCIFWLMNSTFKMYPIAFASDFLCAVSTVVGLIRYREKKAD